MSAQQEEFAQSVAKLLQEAARQGYGVTFGEAFRTPEQALLNAEHGSGIVHSLHTLRLAVDLNFFRNGQWIRDGSQLASVGTYWKSLGPLYRWGGDIVSRPDGNHFSLSPDGKTI